MDLGINFVARSYLTVPYSHQDAPVLNLLCSLMSNLYLHRELREKGGAYGGGVRYSPISGILSFFTYRDPLGYQRSLNTFDKSIEWAMELSKTVSEEVKKY